MAFQLTIQGLAPAGTDTLLITKATKGKLKVGNSLQLKSGSGKFFKIASLSYEGKTVQQVDLKTTGAILTLKITGTEHALSVGDVLQPAITFVHPNVVPDVRWNRPIDFDPVVVVDRGPIISIEDLFKPKKPIGITLQGGGIKGAFGVGALSYLQLIGIIHKDKQLVLSSASTGSLTSIVLASRANNALDLGIEQYTSLQALDDMFLVRKEVIRIAERNEQIKFLLLGALRDGDISGDQLAEEMKEYLGKTIKSSIVSALKNPITYVQPFIAGPVIAALKAADEVEKFVKDVADFMNVKQSLATLDPVEKKLKTVIDEDLLSAAVKNKRVKLRMAVTSLSTGATCYVTEKLELLYPKDGTTGDGTDYSEYDACRISSIGGTNPNEAGVGLRNALVQAALTSGAFPAFFEPKEIAFTRDGGSVITELFTDGGIRENLPVQKLLDEGTEEVIAIHCSPISDYSRTLPDTKSYTWGKVMQESLGFINAENARADMTVGQSVNTQLHGSGDQHVLHIAPTVSTLGLTEIDPYKIRTTIWYGYLRAYDEVLVEQLAKSGKAALEVAKAKSDLRTNSANIYLALRALYLAAGNLITRSAYRVPQKKGAKKYKYTMWNGKDHMVPQVVNGHIFMVPSSSLRNEDEVLYLACDVDSLHDYYNFRLQLLTLYVQRADLTKRHDPENYKKCLPGGKDGLLQFKYYNDWFGVYETLDKMNLAINKRGRLKSQFAREDSRGTNRDHFFLTPAILNDSSAGPRRISSIKSSAYDFPIIRADIIKQLAKVDAIFGLSGSKDSKYEQFIIYNNNDNAYSTRDSAFIS